MSLIGFALGFLTVIPFVCGVPIENEKNKMYDRLFRLKRQSIPGSMTFGQTEGSRIAPLRGILPDDSIASSSGGQVNVAQPSASIGRSSNLFGLFGHQQGVQNAGFRDGSNVGASWGNQNNILGGLTGWGNQNNVDVNTQTGALGIQKQNGIPGIATMTDNTKVNPLGLQFGQEQRQCFGGLLLGGDGLCTVNNKGLGPSGR